MLSHGCSENLIAASFDQVTRSGWGEGCGCNLNVSKVQDTVSHSILLKKLKAHDLDRCTLSGCTLSGWQSPENGGEWNEMQLAAGL